MSSKKSDVAAATEAVAQHGVTIDVHATTAQDGLSNGHTKHVTGATPADVAQAVREAKATGKEIKVEMDANVLGDLLAQNGFKDEARRLRASNKLEGIRSSMKGALNTNIKVRHVVTVAAVAGVGAFIYWAGKKYVMPFLFGEKVEVTAQVL